ncbi:hypothetical protein GCM10010264_21920 [Streptomyces globisporus]|nr:hypothetical protein GCM10010264_21920 [Streptomyces globisporus]
MFGPDAAAFATEHPADRYEGDEHAGPGCVDGYEVGGGGNGAEGAPAVGAALKALPCSGPHRLGAFPVGGEVEKRLLGALVPAAAVVGAGPQSTALAVESVEGCAGLLQGVEVCLIFGGECLPGAAGIGAADQAQVG